MPLNRRQFIASSSLTAGGLTLFALGASADGIPLSANDILADRSLASVYRAVNHYGECVRMSRHDDAIRVYATIRDFSAFGEAYSFHGVADGPVNVLSGNTLSFTRSQTSYVVEHAL